MQIAAVDTETNGLFPHKGCEPFMLTACTYQAENYLWQWDVDPKTRKVQYDKKTKKDVKDFIFSLDAIIFHNANFDIQMLSALGIDTEDLFKSVDVHDTIVMSHAYKSCNKHGLKDLALLLAEIPDTDEHILANAVKKARTLAKKLGWTIADKNDEHESILGTKSSHFKCDYWIPYQIAKQLNYSKDHPWFSVCGIYGGQDAERTMCIFQLLQELLLSIPTVSKFQFYTKDFPPSDDYTRIPGPRDRTNTLWDKYNEARQLILPILRMQRRGIPVIKNALSDSISLFSQRKQDSLKHLQNLCEDEDFNPLSSKQLQTKLFEHFKFEPVKETATGHSTDKDTISALIKKFPVNAPRIPTKYKFLVGLKEFRKEKTTLSYLDNYKNHVLPLNNISTHFIIHGSYSQIGTGTNRLSCKMPNLTNVGKKDMSNPLADEKNKTKASLISELLGIEDNISFSLRNLFGPLPGRRLTCIDYDQFQLRIFAVVSESYELLEGFERGDDIHNLVAKIIFEKDDISDVERTAAKAINFGLLFGAGPGKIELMAGMKGVYKKFTSNFPKAKRYLDTQASLARTNGYVHTVGGYRLYVPPKTPYAASCYVIQGTEAEIVRNAMVRIEQENFQTYSMMLMVHDELVFDSGDHDFQELQTIMKIMEDTGKEIGIPCKVDAKETTTTWANRSSLTIDNNVKTKKLHQVLQSVSQVSNTRRLPSKHRVHSGLSQC
jgi:DNA polymerase I-like protein with 3'-5' exonuclease and polymerase domains